MISKRADAAEPSVLPRGLKAKSSTRDRQCPRRRAMLWGGNIVRPETAEGVFRVRGVVGRRGNDVVPRRGLTDFARSPLEAAFAEFPQIRQGIMAFGGGAVRYEALSDVSSLES